MTQKLLGTLIFCLLGILFAAFMLSEPEGSVSRNGGMVATKNR